MPNWCNTSLVFEGDKQEIKTLYQTMKKLERRKRPLVENGFGSNWLGCLVEALGGHWKETYCRGTWFSLKCQGNILRMETETAWSPSMSNGILTTTRDIVTCIIIGWSEQVQIKRTVRLMGCLASVPYRRSRQHICCHILG